MLEIGSLIDGKYRILRVVGKGGMSVVYQAVNEKANKIWAIKEVRKDGVQNYEVVKQNLIVETDLLKRFNHPNLPSIIDVIDGDGSFLIVMDYIEGNSLSKALETSGAQSQEDVVEWSKELCDVLGYLHSRTPPIIYRDMKPANVMLKPDGHISLIDFGTAREFKSSAVEDTTCLGTQGYAAPEQYGGHGQTDARTDIYCLGATMYHLLTGHNPSLPPYEMYPIRQWNPDLSSGLEKIILKCTQRNPDDRYQSCAELLYDLDHYTEIENETLKRQRIKWRVFMASVIAMLVTAFATVGFSVAASTVTSQTFSSLVNEGDRYLEAIDVDPQAYQMAEEKYLEAIKVEPGNVQAYIGLYKLYTKDKVITTAEYSNLQKHDRYNSEKLAENDEATYVNDFIIPLADSLSFSYERKGGTETNKDGMKLASAWYARALKMPAITERNRNKADVMFKIGSEIYDVGLIDKTTGEVKLSYKQYWDLLNQMVDEDLFVDSNLLIRLHVLKTVANELANNPDNWVDAGISLNDYLAALDKVESKTLKIRSSDTYSANTARSDGDELGLEEMTESILKNIATAKATGYGNLQVSQ